MSQIKLAGIKRETKYSPNHIGNDGMIFSLTTDHLKKMGYEIQEYTEAEFVINNVSEQYIFSMARDRSTIKRLKGLEEQGALILNSGTGVENCSRERMTRLLIDNQIPYPKSVITDVANDPTKELEAMNAPAYWIKRGDSHAIHREDVTYARSIEEVKSILVEFGFRDIPNAVINEHLVGDLIKFYGVADTDFFYWFYPYDLTLTKFGLEAVNGQAKEFPFDLAAFKSACNNASKLLDVGIYGGDCIVAADGSFKIIDFNDWPSFAPCREQAAPYIAQYIHQQVSSSR